MTEALKVLEELGSKTIKEQTRISEVAIGAIINKEFDKLHRVQLHGFINILEDHYDINLNGLLDEYDAYQKEHGVKEQKLFMHIPQEKKPVKGLRLIIPLILIVAVVLITYFILERKSGIQIDVSEQNSQPAEAIQKAKEHLDLATLSSIEHTTSIDEANATTELEVTQIITTESDKNEVKRVLRIEPKVQVWAGMVNLDTHAKMQKTAIDQFDLNTSKNWIILLGHGRVNIHSTNNTLKFDTAEMLRFSYIDGVIEEISREKFKELNLGQDW